MRDSGSRCINIIRIGALMAMLPIGLPTTAFAADSVIVVDPWPVVGSESESLEFGFYADGPCPDAVDGTGSFSIEVRLIGGEVSGGPPAVQKTYSITLKRGEYGDVEVPFLEFGAGNSVPVTVSFERPPGQASCGALFTAGTFDTTTGATRSSGVRWFNTAKGFGFIEPAESNSDAKKQGVQDVFLNHVRKVKVGAVGERLETSFLGTCRGESEDDDSTSLVPLEERSITIRADFYDPYGSIAPQFSEVVLHDGELASVVANFGDFGSGMRVPIISEITLVEGHGPCSVTSSERTYDATTGETRVVQPFISRRADML